MSVNAYRITEFVVEQTIPGYSVASAPAINLHRPPRDRHNHNHNQIPSEANNP